MGPNKQNKKKRIKTTTTYFCFFVGAKAKCTPPSGQVHFACVGQCPGSNTMHREMSLPPVRPRGRSGGRSPREEKKAGVSLGILPLAYTYIHIYIRVLFPPRHARNRIACAVKVHSYVIATQPKSAPSQPISFHFQV